MDDATITERELRDAFKRSGLWRDGWTYARAITTEIVLRGLRNTALAIRTRQQQHGKPAPIQRALQLTSPRPCEGDNQRLGGGRLQPSRMASCFTQG